MFDNKKINKAVFPVAGLGTRLLPITKSVPKELLPVASKVLLQHAIDEAVKAGIETLIFVTSRDKPSIEKYLSPDKELINYLLSRGDFNQAKILENIIPNNVECVFINQSEQLGLGHAILCAEDVVGGEPFAVLLSDDLLECTENDATKKLVQSYLNSGKSQLLFTHIDGPDISKFGVLLPGEKVGLIKGLIEKPDYKIAPSNMASLGRYILQNNIFSILRTLLPGANGEIQLADAINIQAISGEVEGIKFNGKYFDCGSLQGYEKAAKYFNEKL